MKITAVASLFLIAGPISQAVSSNLHPGEQFIKAQIKLHASGWFADPSAHAATGEYMGVERQLVQNGFIEVDYCSLGESSCVLQYVKNGDCIRIHTRGEEIHSMKISSWSHECRDKGANENTNPLPADVRYAIQWRGDCDDFGQCEGMEKYLFKLKKKYVHEPAIMKLLGASQDGEEPKKISTQ